MNLSRPISKHISISVYYSICVRLTEQKGNIKKLAYHDISETKPSFNSNPHSPIYAKQSIFLLPPPLTALFPTLLPTLRQKLFGYLFNIGRKCLQTM